MRATKEQRDAIHSVLKAMEKENRLAPVHVVEEAKNPESPLHGEFTWDVQEAANLMWLHQARTLISSFEVSITVNTKEYRVREFVEHPTKPEKEQGYASIGAIRNSKMMAREFIERELVMASSYVSKTFQYAEILGVRNRVEHLVSDIDGLRGDLTEMQHENVSAQ